MTEKKEIYSINKNEILKISEDVFSFKIYIEMKSFSGHYFGGGCLDWIYLKKILLNADQVKLIKDKKLYFTYNISHTSNIYKSFLIILNKNEDDKVYLENYKKEFHLSLDELFYPDLKEDEFLIHKNYDLLDFTKENIKIVNKKYWDDYNVNIINYEYNKGLINLKEDSEKFKGFEYLNTSNKSVILQETIEKTLHTYKSKNSKVYGEIPEQKFLAYYWGIYDDLKHTSVDTYIDTMNNSIILMYAFYELLERIDKKYGKERKEVIDIEVDRISNKTYIKFNDGTKVETLNSLEWTMDKLNSLNSEYKDSFNKYYLKYLENKRNGDIKKVVNENEEIKTFEGVMNLMENGNTLLNSEEDVNRIIESYIGIPMTKENIDKVLTELFGKNYKSILNIKDENNKFNNHKNVIEGFNKINADVVNEQFKKIEEKIKTNIKEENKNKINDARDYFKKVRKNLKNKIMLIHISELFLFVSFLIGVTSLITLPNTLLMIGYKILLPSILIIILCHLEFVLKAIIDILPSYNFIDKYIIKRTFNTNKIFGLEWKIKKLFSDYYDIEVEEIELDSKKYLEFKFTLKDYDEKYSTNEEVKEAPIKEDIPNVEEDTIDFNEESIKDDELRKLLNEIINLINEIGEKSSATLRSIKRIYTPSIKELIDKYLKLDGEEFINKSYIQTIKNDLSEVLNTLKELLKDDKLYETLEVESISKMMLMKIQEFKNDFKKKDEGK